MPIGPSRRASALDPLIRRLLRNGPRLRQFIEATLVYEYRAKASTVVDRLGKLATDGTWLIRRRVPYEGSERRYAYLYSLEEPTQQDLYAASALLKRRDDVLNRYALGVTAQNHVYGLVIRSELFARPRKASVGNQGLLKCDLLAYNREYSPSVGPFLFEVKNEQQAFQPAAEEILELVEKAIEEDSFPVFVAAHVTGDTLRVCRALGVHVVYFGRQLIPKSHGPFRTTKPHVDNLRPTVLGLRTPYEFVSMKRFYQDGITIGGMRDLRLLRNFLGMSYVVANWRQNRAAIERALRTERSWAAVRRAVPLPFVREPLSPISDEWA